MIKKNVVLIADRVQSHREATLFNKDLEVVCDSYFFPMMQALQTISPKVTHYTSPYEFTSNIELHRNDVVLSVWAGINSRNRRTLIPAICEANHIPYVGADAYTNAICQDKDLTKALCTKYGIESPAGVLLYSLSDMHKLEHLRYPIIIKPNFEGGSIGIFSDNVVWDYDQACKFSSILIQEYCPVLAEELVPGQEVYICVVGTQQHIDIFQAVRQHQNGKVDIEYDIVSAEYKKLTNETQGWDTVTEQITQDLRRKIEKLYFELGKVELIRVDGRLNENGFQLIELSPDVGLSTVSTISQAFEASGYAYEEMFEIILNNALIDLGFQNANK